MTGRFVRKIQRALIAQGFPLPVFGDDSVYGPETAQAVSLFKQREEIFPADGVVGQATMARFDQLFANEPGPPIVLDVGEMTVDDLLEAVQDAETANAADTPEEFLTRLRQLYYPGTNPDGLAFQQLLFDQLMPTSPLFQASGARRILTPAGMDGTMFARLSAHAFENAVPPKPPDNPGPYVVDDTATRVDLGHVLLTIEAIFHPVAGPPYTSFGIPPIDPASWVADVGSAAVWAELNGEPNASTKLPPSPTDNVADYFKMSAPNVDLVGDIDGFNIANIWIGTGGNLSVPLTAYYIDGDQAPGGYRRRFRDFLTNNVGDPDNPLAWRLMSAAFETRINRFNDLFSRMKDLLALAGRTFRPPPRKTWRRTADVLEMFFGFLERGVNVEKDTFD